MVERLLSARVSRQSWKMMASKSNRLGVALAKVVLEDTHVHAYPLCLGVAFCIELDHSKWGAIYKGMNVHNQVTVPLVEAGAPDSSVVAGT